MSRMGAETSRLRKEAGMTQKQLAKLVGVSESFIIDMEAGRRILNSDLAAKISRALCKEVSSLDLYDDGQSYNKPEPDKNVVKVIEKPVQEVWREALSGVIHAVPVYGLKMDSVLETKQLPVIGNKVEGFPKDNVLYLAIENNEMLGFRIMKGDMAFACKTNEVYGDAIYLIEYGGKRLVRQVKPIGGDKLLLVYNSGRLVTETVLKKDVKVIAKLIRIEITL